MSVSCTSVPKYVDFIFTMIKLEILVTLELTRNRGIYFDQKGIAQNIYNRTLLDSSACLQKPPNSFHYGRIPIAEMTIK